MIERRYPMFLVLGLVTLGLLTLSVYAVRSEDDFVAPPPAAQTWPESVTPWACPSGAGSRVECAYLESPANLDDPEIAAVELFVARAKAPTTAPEGLAPIVYLGNYLDGASDTSISEWTAVSQLLERDVVMLDLRSTGRSNPQIACPDVDRDGWLEADLAKIPNGEVLTAHRNALQSCTERLPELKGTPTYNYEALALDVQTARQRLEIDEWIIVASADAVPVAIAAEQLDPAGTTALALFRAAPVADDPFDQRASYAEEVLALTFECAGSNCQSGNGARLNEAIESIGQRSLVFSVPTAGGRQRVSVNSATVRPALASAVIDDSVQANIPRLLGRFEAEQWRDIAVLRARGYSARHNRSSSVRLALGCDLIDPIRREDLRFLPVAAPAKPDAETDSETDSETDDGETQDQAEQPEDTDELSAADQLRADRAAVWRGLLDDPTLNPALCNKPPQPAFDPPSSPTLIVNHAADFMAPASAATELARQWPQAKTVLVSTGGAPDLFTACGQELVSSFLDNTPTLTSGCS